MEWRARRWWFIIYISNLINYKRRPNLELGNNIKSIWTEISYENSKPIIVCTAYRPPSTPPPIPAPVDGLPNLHVELIVHSAVILGDSISVNLKLTCHQINRRHTFLILNLSLSTHYSGWMSCLISFAWSSPSCYQRDINEKFKMIMYASAGNRTCDPLLSSVSL